MDRRIQCFAQWVIFDSLSEDLVVKWFEQWTQMKIYFKRTKAKHVPVHQWCFDKFESLLLDSLSFSSIPKTVDHFWIHSNWQGLVSFNFSVSASSCPHSPHPQQTLCQLANGLHSNTEDTLGDVMQRALLSQDLSIWVFVNSARVRGGAGLQLCWDPPQDLEIKGIRRKTPNFSFFETNQLLDLLWSANWG